MQSKLASVLFAATMTITGAIVMATFTPSAASAQTAPPTMQSAAGGNSSLDVAVTYNATLSNVVTSARFALQGGSIQIHGRFYRGWGVVADIAGAHTPGINSTGVGLDLVTATFGPRYTWSPAHARYSLFAQALTGQAFGLNSVFPNPMGATTSAYSLAVKTGGGVNLNLKPHLALRLIEADYLRTQLPNATSNVQNSVTLGAGIVLRCW